MKLRLQKAIFQLAEWLINRSPKCPTCKGSGFRFWVENLGKGVTQDMSEPCVTCEQYGRYPLGWFTRFVISRLPD